ncbi:MAG: hypothetical protein PHD01_08870, partial [Geobacteraceae bacterium]|nr:hypothetical protein [Geobacteraceae bacterium]
MKDYSAKTRLETGISTAEPGMDAPLWLLQKDDTRMLYLSFLLSVTVHIILFVVMAATHIFQPFAGTSQEFDLVWFSPSTLTTPMVSTTSKPSAPIKGTVRTAQKAPATSPRPAVIPKVKAETRPPSPAKATTTPATSPAQASSASAQVQTSNEVPIEEPSEMVISRFGGKVVDVIDKKADIPTFSVISSVTKKSATARAVVKTIRETVKETPKTRGSIPRTKPSEGTMVASLPKEGPTGKQEEKGSVTVPQAKQTSRNPNVIKQQPIQGKASSSTIAATPHQSLTHLAVNRNTNSFAAALEALSASGSKLATKEQASQKQENSAGSTEKTSTLKTPTEATPPSLPPTVEKPAVQEVKQAPQLPPPPQILLQPPVTGDLNLIITGDVDIQVEAFFKPFLKNRRSKAFTRWEAERRRSVKPKMVRTKENV